MGLIWCLIAVPLITAALLLVFKDEQARRPITIGGAAVTVECHSLQESHRARAWPDSDGGHRALFPNDLGSRSEPHACRARICGYAFTYHDLDRGPGR